MGRSEGIYTNRQGRVSILEADVLEDKANLTIGSGMAVPKDRIGHFSRLLSQIVKMKIRGKKGTLLFRASRPEAEIIGNI